MKKMSSTVGKEYSKPVVAICGATGGIGAALVKAYAAPGTTLLLAGRRREVLEQLKTQSEAAGARVVVSAFDLRDRELLEHWCADAARSRATVLILAAGVSASVEGISDPKDPKRTEWLPESNEDLLRELQVNAVGNILGANMFVREVLTSRRKGSPKEHVQVVFVASLAALTGLPGSPGYSASKAALRTYGEALRRLTEPVDIGVTVLFPGYVQSEMSRRYQGAKPWMMSADSAALIMKRAIERRDREYAFPKILALGIALLKFVPTSWEHFFLKHFFFTVEPDAESVHNRRSVANSSEHAAGNEQER